MVICGMPRLPLLAAALLAALLVPATASAEAQWIWTAKNNVTNQQTWARTVVDLKDVPANATLLASRAHGSRTVNMLSPKNAPPSATP